LLVLMFSSCCRSFVLAPLHPHITIPRALKALLLCNPFAGTLTTSNLLLSCYSHIHARDSPLSLGRLGISPYGTLEMSKSNMFSFSLYPSYTHHSLITILNIPFLAAGKRDSVDCIEYTYCTMYIFSDARACFDNGCPRGPPAFPHPNCPRGYTWFQSFVL